MGRDQRPIENPRGTDSGYDGLTKVAKLPRQKTPSLVKKPFTYWTLFDPGVLFMETGSAVFQSNEICRESCVQLAYTRVCIRKSNYELFYSKKRK